MRSMSSGPWPHWKSHWPNWVTTSSRVEPLPRPSKCSSVRRIRLRSGDRAIPEDIFRSEYGEPSIVARRVLVTDSLAEEGLIRLREEPGIEVVVDTKLAQDSAR